MVLALQTVYQVQPLVYLRQPLGVEVYVLRLAGYVAGYVLQLYQTALQPVCHPLYFVVERCHSIYSVRSLPYNLEGAVFSAQHVVGIIEGRLYLLRMRGSLLLVLQFFLLSCLESCLRKLRKLEAHVVLLLSRLVESPLHLLQLQPSAFVFGENGAVFCQQFVVVGYYVEHVQLEILFLQQQVLVLRVYVHQHLAQLFHLLHGYGCVVYKSAALSRCRQFASYYALTILLSVQFVFLKPFSEVVA